MNKHSGTFSAALLLLATNALLGCGHSWVDTVSLGGGGIYASREMFLIQGTVTDFCLVPQPANGARLFVVGPADEILAETIAGLDGKFTIRRHDVRYTGGPLQLKVEDGVSLPLPQELMENREGSGMARLVRRCRNMQDAQYAANLPLPSFGLD